MGIWSLYQDTEHMLIKVKGIILRLLVFSAQFLQNGAAILHSGMCLLTIECCVVKRPAAIGVLQGLLAGRDQKSLSAEKKEFQRMDAESREYAKLGFAQAIAKIKSTALVGATAKQGSFNQESIRNLVKVCSRQFGTITKQYLAVARVLYVL